MEILWNYSPIAVKFDDTDKAIIIDIGLEAYFKNLKKDEIFDLDGTAYYNGECFFLSTMGEIICYDCLKDCIEWIEDFDYLTFLIEDIDDTYYCENCNKKIQAQYEND